MPAALIVLCGPPLPGRWSLARALAERLGARRFLASDGAPTAPEVRAALEQGTCVLIDGDLPRRAERKAMLEIAPDAERVLVEWRCPEAHAEREIFHRYASRPLLLAQMEHARYLADARQRQPVGPSDYPEIALIDARLPLDRQVAEVAAHLSSALPQGQARAHGRPRILVVEDDADERVILTDVLHELDCEVEPAPDAGVALALLDDGARFDVVLSDQRMPGMSGIELARQLHARYPRVRTILLTAYGEDPLYNEALEANALAVLRKPLRVIDLERVLEEAGAPA